MIELTVFAVAWIAWTVGEAITTSCDRPEPGTLAVPTALALCAVHIVALVEHSTPPTVLLVAGTVLLAVGIAVRLWAIVSLGTSFATRLGAAKLVTTGPYRFVRHPSDLGLIAAAYGGAAVLCSPTAAAIAVVLVPLAIVRGRREDTALASLRA